MKTIYVVLALLLIGCGGNAESSTVCPTGDTCTPDEASDAGADAIVPEVSMVEGARLLCVLQVCEQHKCGVAPDDDCIGEIVTCDKCGDR